MSEPSVLAKECPACHARPLQPIPGLKGVGAPTHRCASCGALLKPAFTSRAVLSLPIGAAVFGLAYFVITWLNQSLAISDGVRARVLGGIGAFCTSVILWSLARGMVFRVVKQCEP